MRKGFDKNRKVKEIAMSYIENNDNDIVKDHEFEHCFGLGNPKIKDLTHENICLQKMINDAKKEQAVLKKAIDAMFD